MDGLMPISPLPPLEVRCMSLLVAVLSVALVRHIAQAFDVSNPLDNDLRGALHDLPAQILSTPTFNCFTCYLSLTALKTTFLSYGRA